jgi:hypothetical protein
MVEGKGSNFMEDDQGTSGSRTGFVTLRLIVFVRPYLRKHMT